MDTHQTTPYRIALELDSVMDLVSMLRGMTINNRFYKNLTSDELSRFASYDCSQWLETLPGNPTFDKFLFDAIAGNTNNKQKLFDKVRPYDYAQQNIEYLHRNGATITLAFNSTFLPYHGFIQQWVDKIFPQDEVLSEIKVVPWQSIDIVEQDICVVRNPESIRYLTQLDQPHIVLDAIENRSFIDSVRTLRWDQLGFLLRHAQKIDTLNKYAFSEEINFGHQITPLFPRHTDIWNGNPYIILPIDVTQYYLGQQKRSLELVLEKPQERLKSIHNNRPVTDEILTRQGNALKAIAFDLNEINRKTNVLSEIVTNTNQKKIDHFDWVQVLLTRDQEMQSQIDAICEEFDINPNSGNNIPNQASVRKKVYEDFDKRRSHSDQLTQKIVNGNPDNPLFLHLSGSEVIHLFSENWNVLKKQRLSSSPSEIAGQLGELTVAFLFQQDGWKLLASQRSNEQGVLNFLWQLPNMIEKNERKSSHSNKYNRIDIQWIDKDTNELLTANVDLLTRKKIHDRQTGKSKTINVIVEIKISSLTELSPLQKKLRKHIKSGGRILNLGYPGIRSKTLEAHWREIRIGDGLVRTLPPVLQKGI